MEYSLDSYRSIIGTALTNGFSFVPFNLPGQRKRGSIYLRHDVDYSLEMALRLARVNAEMKVAGTFFVLLRSHAYNLLSRSSQSLVRKIHELGQSVAFHAVIEKTALDQISSSLRSDFQFAQREFPFLMPAFSWHNPTRELMESTASLDEIGGLINVYASRFTREVVYRSDSNMRFKPEEFLQLIAVPQERALQLLFHPLNWVIGGDKMNAVLSGAWPYLIREQEHEMKTNIVYQEQMPEGMPASVLNNFSELLLAAMKKQGNIE